jgi:serine/threonine protein kinase
VQQLIFTDSGLSIPLSALGTRPLSGALIEHWARASGDLQEFAQPGSLWSISPAAKDLLSQLLRKDPAQRLDAQAVLEHPWLALEGAYADDAKG